MKLIKKFNLFEQFNDDDPFGEETNHRDYEKDYAKIKSNLLFIGRGGDRNFIIYTLGMRNIIDEMFGGLKVDKNLSDEYQLPLKYLYSTNKYSEIQKNGDKYYCERLKGSLLLDENGEWDYANKLNTNGGDLALVLADLFKKEGMANLADLDIFDFKRALVRMSSNLYELILKNFSAEELRQYTENIRLNTERGERAETFVQNAFEKMGWTILYRGGNGDFIDMIFGCDLIVQSPTDNIRTVQVKSSERAIDDAVKRYAKIDMIVSPTSDSSFTGFQIRSNGELKRINGGN